MIYHQMSIEPWLKHGTGKIYCKDIISAGRANVVCLYEDDDGKKMIIKVARDANIY